MYLARAARIFEERNHCNVCRSSCRQQNLFGFASHFRMEQFCRSTDTVWPETGLTDDEDYQQSDPPDDEELKHASSHSEPEPPGYCQVRSDTPISDIVPCSPRTLSTATSTDYQSESDQTRYKIRMSPLYWSRLNRLARTIDRRADEIYILMLLIEIKLLSEHPRPGHESSYTKALVRNTKEGHLESARHLVCVPRRC